MAEHVDGCPLARPWLYNLDEQPLDCICEDLLSDDEPESHWIGDR